MPVKIKCYCSVPFCSNSKRKQPQLSFHDFPKDKHVRVKWITAIRREESAKFTVQRGSTYVCSQHFRPEELYVRPGGSRVRLMKGSVPSRFVWNNFGSRRETRQTPDERASTRPGSDIEAAMGERGVQEIEAMRWEPAANVMEHDYSRPPAPGE
uniref:THAP domain-containing protein 1 n=1 Tax=Amphilophus citrinellus TaxID=61819 RepID=A0A3Q0S1D2_AMPCI